MIVLYVIKNHSVYMHLHILIALNSIKDSNVSCAGSVIGGIRGASQK
jgi:hypothetical protein